MRRTQSNQRQSIACAPKNVSNYLNKSLNDSLQIDQQQAQIQKYKFDNQILMKKLSEYKRAEKNALSVLDDYEQMKVKYFSVLQENERNKMTIQSHIQKEIDSTK